ncbi:MAG: ABC transporter ATP-binding protein [Candidatus Reconcilbacillus cellulovorans]|uniref:ABC transporter ATP-binding protein n=1 Tax=Candidatus Reconcilbacillus cellulovorans TaxID=1906605 RepID=A0A2A6DYZ7_9BACL|nr:MAG: ABC transporter ATP-binding protein [Candidatus Reconcilbacillus cellulovorans]
MIRLSGVKKSYRPGKERIPVLDIPDWTVEAGERVAVVGPSGSGKSTLLHLIAGVLTPEEGDVFVAGERVSAMEERERDSFRSRMIGYVFQDFYLIPGMTARENVEFVLPRRMPSSEKNRLLRDWFARLGLADRMNRMPSELSRGERQRVAIIRALVRKPPVVLADEPTASLDPEAALDVTRILVDLCREENLTLVFVTHDPDVANLLERTVRMRDLSRPADPQAVARPEGCR